MARVTGIELTETAVRVVDLDGSPKKPRVLNAVNVPVAGDASSLDRTDEYVQALKVGLKAVRPKKDQVVLGLPASDALIREIIVPFKDKDQIRKVIKFESETHLPTADIDDMIISFHKAEEMGPRSRLIIFAVSKDALRRHLRVLSKAGIEPKQVDLSPAALFNCLTLHPDIRSEIDQNEEAIQVVLDVGERNTNVIIMKGDGLRLVRTMHLGSESLTRHMTSKLGMDQADAETATQELLSVDEPFATGASREHEPSSSTALKTRGGALVATEQAFARRLLGDLRRTLSSIQLEGRVSTLWLTGTGSTVPGLEQDLRRGMGVDVRPLNPLDGVDHSLPNSASLFTGPGIGLGFKAMEHDLAELEFRQEEFRFARKFDRLRTPLLFAGVLAMVLFLFLALVEYKRADKHKAELNHLARNAQQLFTNYVVKHSVNYKYMGFDSPDHPKEILDRAAKLPVINQVSTLANATAEPLRFIKREYGIDASDPQGSQQIAVSALRRLDQWYEVMNKVLPGLDWPQVTRLKISTENITWTMMIDVDQENPMAKFDNEFQKLEGFAKFEPGIQKQEGKYLVYTNCRLDFERER